MTVSKRARNLLKRIFESEEVEVVYEPGGGWWLDCTRPAPRDIWELIRACLLDSGGSIGTGFERWTPTSDAKRVLEDPNYEPPIFAALRKQRSRA